MTAPVIGLLVGALVVALAFFGMLTELVPSIIRARADLELARHGHGGYPASVVHTAVRGALIVSGSDVEAADRQADIVIDELEDKSVVFDGRDWLPIVR